LKLKWEIDGSAGDKLKASGKPLSLPVRVPDADSAVNIEAYGVIPLVYDRMALALMHEFGPVVEFAPYDWRQPVDYLGEGLAARIEALTGQCPAIQIALVAHSMGGLVAADALTKLEVTNASVLDSVKSLVVLGAPFLGSGSALQALRAEKRGLNLLKLLGRKSTGDIENTVQTFRGLFDMLPGDQEELMKPALFAPGPLSRLLPDDARFGSPLSLVRDLPATLLGRTRAIVCTTRSTIGAVEVLENGSVDYSCTVAGDGTVSAKSALNADKLLSQSNEVDEGHMTLLLDGRAIEHTVDWIGQQFGASSTKSSFPSWPAAPDIRLPNSRDELIRHLEADDELTLGDFVALISLI
jgi:pimeloyl-ACP methyl ester carboxylesterase